MIMIVAHHYLVNSGLIDAVMEAPVNGCSIVMMLFGAWGKTGINCFVLITGYFMCRSQFSWYKFIKLYLQVIFYAIIIYGIFCYTGHEIFTIGHALKIFMPFHSISDGFTSCFLAFYLFIPFLNILIQNLSKRQHMLLVALTVGIYTILSSLTISVHFNYVTWFSVLYIVASYLRFYGDDLRISHRQWGWLTICSILLGALSIVTIYLCKRVGIIHSLPEFFLVSDSNKLFALLIGVTSFMWFKDLKIRYSKFINTVGAATFGVLCIHANSDAMRQWLWRETVDCVGHFNTAMPLETIGYATLTVLIIFAVCAGIDYLRGRFIEPLVMHRVQRLLNTRISGV